VRRLFSRKAAARHSADAVERRVTGSDRIFRTGVGKTLDVLGVETQADFADAALVERDVAPGHAELEGWPR